MDARQQNVRTWAMLCHLGALAGFLFSPLTVLGPVILWQIKKNELPEINQHGKDAVNFQLTIFIINFAIGILLAMMWGGIWGFAILWGNPLWSFGGFGLGFGFASIFVLIRVLLNLASWIFAIIAGIKANNGESFKYPFSYKFIK
jgi:uncharacterized Tic20 family protein